MPSNAIAPTSATPSTAAPIAAAGTASGEPGFADALMAARSRSADAQDKRTAETGDADGNAHVGDDKAETADAADDELIWLDLAALLSGQPLAQGAAQPAAPTTRATGLPFDKARSSKPVGAAAAGVDKAADRNDTAAAANDPLAQRPGCASRTVPPVGPQAATAIASTSSATPMAAGSEIAGLAMLLPARVHESRSDNTAAPAATPAAIAALGVAGLAGGGSVADGAAQPPLQAALHAAPGSPEFAPALGAQLNVLARDGIQHAELQLNPAELGPIGVHIRLDGNTALVDFHAAHATTRAALEQAVPALASALSDAGLTLSGGGVFQQPREPRHAQHGSGEAARSARVMHGERGESNDAALAPAAGSARARGVLDLYA